MKPVIAVAAVLVAAVLGGCWIAMPSNGPADSKTHVGHVYILARDIHVSGGSFHAYAVETVDRKRVTRLREPYTTVKKGSRIQIDSIVSRREEMGVFYYYRCRNLDGAERFELIFDMRDCLGLPKYSYLDERKKG